MASTRLLQRSFLGGELSPEMFGRVDAAVYQNGAALLQNFISKPQGPAFRRPGFRYVAATKGAGATDKAKLIPFTYSNDQTMVIELGSASLSTGTATSVTLATLVNTGASWTTNQYTGYYVYCNGSYAQITSNTTNTLTLSSGWSNGTPSGTTLTYDIYNGYARFHTAGATVYTGTATVASYATQVNQSVALTAGTPGTVTLNGHSFQNGMRVQITGITVSTGELQPNTTYYVVGATTNTFQLSATLSGSALSIGSFTGTPVATRTFEVGDLVQTGGYGFYCMLLHTSVQTPPTLPANSAYWYRLSAWNATLGSIYEVPSPYYASHIQDVHFAQSNDVLTITHNQYYPRELSRYSATKWLLNVVPWKTAADQPINLAGTANQGQRRTITAKGRAVAGDPTSSYIRVTSNGGIGTDSLYKGDNIYIRSTGTNSESTLNARWFVVRAVDVNDNERITLNDLLTGAQWTITTDGPTTIQGTVERLSYISDFTNTYAVTAVYEGGVESAQSASAPVSNGLYSNGNTNLLTWTQVSNAVSYNVYKKSNGIFGRIGSTPQSPTPSFVDDNIAPDLGATPPIYTTPTPLATAGEYPATTAYFEQRRCFAGSVNNPQTFYATRSFTDSDMSYRFPSQDDDRLQFRIRAREVNTIRHIVPLNELLLLTSSAEWRVTSINSDSLTSDSISVRPQSYVGANMVQPEIVNNSLIFCSARGGHVRELGYNWQSQGFVTSDLSLRSLHLFDGYDIIDMCQSKAPHPVIWSVSSSGKLLGLTYIPEEQVAAWHQHTTAGTFQSCCTVSEGAEDVLYVIARRTINGTTRNYVERMAQMTQPTTLADCYMMDCGGTATGTNLTTVTGLDWLNGATVQVLADGKVHRNLTVSAGTITLDYAASKIQYGLPYVSNMQTLPVSMQIDGAGQGRAKNINKAWLRVSKTSGCKVGPDADHLVQTNLYESTPTEKTEEIPVLLTPAWSQDGRVYVQQSDPLPLTLVGLTIECAVGG